MITYDGRAYERVGSTTRKKPQERYKRRGEYTSALGIGFLSGWIISWSIIIEGRRRESQLLPLVHSSVVRGSTFLP
jgi:hypothetical protein